MTTRSGELAPAVDGARTTDRRKRPLSLKEHPPTPGGNHLETFKLVSQRPQSNWCWAANSDAVSGHYGNRMEKCKVVTRVLRTSESCLWEDAWGKGSLGSNQCCKQAWPLTGDTDPCASTAANGNTNRRGRVVCGLLAVKHFNAFKNFAFDLAQVKTEIDGQQPLIMQVRWDGGGQHYVAITGYDDKHNLSIADPMSDSMAAEDGHWTTMHIGDAGDQYYAPEGGWGTWIATGKTAKEQ